MTPRRALLLLPLLLAAPRFGAAQTPPPDPRALAAQAFAAGAAVRQALPPDATVTPDLEKVLKGAEIVQSGGTKEQDDATFRQAVVDAAEGLGIEKDSRPPLVELYRKRRATGLRASDGSAPDDSAALKRAEEMRRRVGGTKSPFGAARDPGAGNLSPSGSGFTAQGTPGSVTPAPGAALSPVAPLTAGVPLTQSSSVDARIAEALKTPGVQAPKRVGGPPPSVPDLVAATAALPQAKEPPVLPANSKLLNADRFPAYGRQDAAKPASDADIARIEKTFRGTIDRLVREGKRVEGSGAGWALVNNMRASLVNGKGERCYDQAEELLADLAKEFHASGGPQFVEPRGRWMFKMTSYTDVGGAAHESTGHYWVTAISREPGDPTLILDPWSGQIKRSAEKSPVVTKGFVGWVLGAVVSKIVD